MNNIRFNALFKSIEYQQELNRLSKEIITKCKNAENEATVASCFESSLYHFIKDFFGKEIDPVKEKNLGNSTKHTFSNKRMDAVYNNLIIEYKHFSKLKSKQDIISAENQTINYLNEHLKVGMNFEAVLTDGIKVKFIYITNNTIHSSEFSQLNFNNLDRIVKNLLFYDKKKLAGNNIAKDFTIDSSNHLSKRLATILFNSIKDEKITEKTNMLFVEWRDLFHLSEADKGKNQDIDKRRLELSKIFHYDIENNDIEYKALFSLQTTYAIVVKLVAFKVLSQITSENINNIFGDFNLNNSMNLKSFFQQLEDGFTFRNSGIRNLLEGDFFAWYCDDNQWSNDIFDAISQIINLLISYEDLKFSHFYEPQDLFKDLYIGTIPKSIRHSYGEYFTPSWLADSVVSNSIKMINQNKWRGIDPTCGSGVFLIKMIDKILNNVDIDTLNKEEKKGLLEEILNRVNGVDLNPLSVLTSRVNYFIAISKLIDYVDEIEIPIYLGDSANLPTTILIDNIPCYQYNIDNKKQRIEVVLPISFVKNKNFSNIMFSLQTLVKVEKSDDIYEIILHEIPKKDRTTSIREKVLELANNLVYLHVNKWDGIWLRIIYNFLSTVKLGKFDIIAGNPPWIKWEFLPQVYATKIKDLCLEKHLFSGSVRTGGISLNICALISNTTATQWLNKNGTLAFLMPKTLMTQQSYEGFRNFYINFETNNRLYLQTIDDWSESGHPFVTVQEKFLTYFFSEKKVDYSNGFPVTKYVKNKNINIFEINQNKDFDSVKKYFTLKKSTALQLSKNKTSFTFINDNSKYNFSDIVGENFYKARSGAEFTPGEIYFLKNAAESKKQNTHIFRNATLKTAKYKVIPNNKLELETEYIYPLVKGPSIKPFSFSQDEHFTIFPYKWGVKNSISFVEMSKNRRMAEYLIDYKNLIEQQSKRSLDLSIGNEFYSLSKIGEYTFVDCLVAFRDNTKMSACVITPIETPWGEKKMPICAKHAPFISMTKMKRKITLDEAHYICGILNTNVVKEYISQSNDSRSFSIDLSIKLPEYDELNKDLKQISELSKKADKNAKKDKDFTQILDEIEKLYIKVCKNIK